MDSHDVIIYFVSSLRLFRPPYHRVKFSVIWSLAHKISSCPKLLVVRTSSRIHNPATDINVFVEISRLIRASVSFRPQQL